jgi:hypothetical protein
MIGAEGSQLLRSRRFAPTCSPDGRWLVCTRCGQESDYLMPIVNLR